MSGRERLQAASGDVPTVVDVWVDAYADDPYLRWLQPDPAAWPEFAREWLTHIADVGSGARGHLYLSQDGDLAMSWIAPGVQFAGSDEIMHGRKVLETHLGEERADEAFDMMLAMRSYMPTEPHWGLNHIAVRPPRQGAGLGTAAVAEILASCDRDGVLCTLVSGNPRNVPFFERLGFVAVGEIPAPDGTVVIRPMRREPRGVSS